MIPHFMLIPLALPVPVRLVLADGLGGITPTEIGLLLLGLATLAGIFKKLGDAKKEFAAEVLGMMAAQKKSRDDERLPQPFLVASETKFATVEQVKAVHEQIIPRSQLLGDLKRIDDEIEEVTRSVREMQQQSLLAHSVTHKQIDDNFRALDGKRSVSIGGLHTALTQVRERVAGAEAVGAANTQDIHALNNRVDRLQRGGKAGA